MANKGHKLTCNVTGNWAYVTNSNYAKLCTQFGSEKDLIANWVSAAARKLRNKLAANEFPNIRKGKETTYGMLNSEQRQKVDMIIAVARNEGKLVPADRIVDVITGEQAACSPGRMQDLIDQARVFNVNADEKLVRETFVTRNTKREMREYATETLGEGKGWNDLTDEQKALGKAQIRAKVNPSFPVVSESHSETESIVDVSPEDSHVPVELIRPIRQKGKVPAHR